MDASTILFCVRLKATMGVAQWQGFWLKDRQKGQNECQEFTMIDGNRMSLF